MNAPAPTLAPTGSRWLSALEFVLGAAIVIGHNVYHVVPNEVPILFVLGLLSLHWRDGLKNVGLARPASWKVTIGIALAAAAVRIGVGEVVERVSARFWPAINAPAGSEAIHADWKQALLWLGLIWTFAAFGEEISYRGYLLTRAADLGKRTTLAYWAAVIATSILFGYGHYYKGPAGVLDSGIAGLILGAAYMLNRKNLWTCILAHGLIDTFGVLALFLGWAS
ncbi:MAG: CPBP family intramembrane metalloprotease [Candidatus Koribacter versatilis]|uniref:CPBP family intramembrane metalloprotease n=1 Tax=Candidatus Korobacter versatilis TaxID=658062 RepID=A0A932EPM7_9BACT|nr:CPBP family intramembrane metalloprotease [Candidatus Koribacter versatilis]